MPRSKFPLGTVIAYGPDTRRATKLVASVFQKSDSDEPLIRRWWCEEGDIRNDADVERELAEFLKEQRVKETLIADRIMGCPHEEGIDYPLGTVCPQCPFWAETDRITHGPKVPEHVTSRGEPIPAVEILVVLAGERREPPFAALAAADARREELTPLLLAHVASALMQPAEASPEEARVFCHALYLLAKWRESLAFPLVLSWLRLPGEGPFEIAGDVLTQAGGRILASVFAGDARPIQALIESREANEFSRSAALDALAILVAWGEWSRDALADYAFDLATHNLEREANHAWSALAALVADAGFANVLPAVRVAFKRGWVDPMFVTLDEIEEDVAAGGAWAEFVERHPPITDVAVETGWWACYHQPAQREPKIGRNDQCPCGSGKKYKKCCGRGA